MADRPESALAPVLSLQGFGLSIQDRIILQSVSFSLPPSGCTVLLGPSGTGKSTLVRTLAGFNDHHPAMRHWGQTSYLGLPLAQENRPALVVQKAQLLVATVLDNLQTGLPDRSRMTRAQQIAHIGQVAAELGEGWVVDEFSTPVINLGLLQQRIVSILREVLRSPALLILDEPTTGMNERDAGRFLDIVRQLARDRAIIVVLHHLAQARLVANQVVLIASGYVQECAETETFFNAPQSEAAQQFIRTGSCPEYPIGAEPPASGTSATLPHEGGESGAGNACSVPTSDQASVESKHQNTQFSLDATTQQEIGLPHVQAKSSACGPRGFVWLLPGQLAGTPWPGIFREVGNDLDDLRNVGVTRLVNLTEEALDPALLAPFGLRTQSLPIPDMHAPTATEAAKLCGDIDSWIRSGEVVALHCRAGLGRTGALLAAYWLWRGRGKRTAIEAIDKIRQLNNNMIQSQEQVQFLDEFARRLAQSFHSRRPTENPL